MTERQEEILDLGWELMKYAHSPSMFLWLAEDGWQGGHQLTAVPHGPGQVQVKIKPWETLVLIDGVPNPN